MRAGAFAPLVVVPAVNCIPLPRTVDRELAALTEPMTIGARAVEVGEVKTGDRVLVLGPGPIGQSIAIMTREAGAAEIVIVGKEDAPRLTCLRSLGFESIIDLADGDFVSQIQSYITPDKFDIVFEATGAGAALQDGLNVLRRQGILVTCAIHATPAAFNVTQLVRQQQQIRGSATGTPATWRTVLGVLERHGDALQAIITHRLPLELALEGFELARQKVAAKVIITPNAS
jgi:threonine dehydrogenase-like Zn-dependent dehydrogenase